MYGTDYYKETNYVDHYSANSQMTMNQLLQCNRDVERKLRMLSEELERTKQEIYRGIVLKGWVCPTCEKIHPPTEKSCECVKVKRYKLKLV